MMDRLSPATIDRLPNTIDLPAYNRDEKEIGIVHLGVGAFHKAHQAVYTDDVLGSKDSGNWLICGVSLRRPVASEELTPQGGLYTVGSRDGSNETRRVIGAICEVLTAPENPETVLDRLANPDVHVITLTITEKGYCIDPATGVLDETQPDLQHDLEGGIPPKTALGFLAEALRRRHEDNRPVTIMSCDNLPHNGARLKNAVLQFTDHVDPELSNWIAENITFPATMVDRIVPATTDEDVAQNFKEMGLQDQGYTKTEPFRQWVIEDNFAGPRPAWEAAGALLVDDVAPFEDAKLRLLNGPHSAIAYIGYLAGKEYVDQVMADETLAGYVTWLMEREIVATVKEPQGMALGTYMQELRTRFSNNALMHRTWQIAMDGSQKLPQRLLNTVRDRHTLGLQSPAIALAIAAWIQYVTGADDEGKEIDVRDPMAQRFARIGQEASQDAQALCRAMLNVREVFGDDIPKMDDFCAHVTRHLSIIMREGSHAAVSAFMNEVTERS